MPPDATTCPHCHAPVPSPALKAAGAGNCPGCGKPLTAPEPHQAEAGGAGRTALIAAAAILALVAAGVGIAHSARDEIRQWLASPRPAPAGVSGPRAEGAAPAPGPTPVPQGDPGAARSVLAVARVGEGSAARPVVLLGRPACSEDFQGALKGTHPGILLREVVRQAVLIAARDELGLATRDEVLGESVAGGRRGEGAEVASVFREGGKSRATIRRVAGAKADPLLDRPLPSFALPKLVETAEALSRTEFPAALRALDLSGKANARRPDAPLPAGTEGRLSRLGDPDLFAAVRGLHAAIRADGESPARVAALARGYALLGVLTEYQWGPAHKAFKARALLYSQRLVTPDPDDPFALWNRAFVRALVGMHAGARADLIWAQKQARDRPGPAPSPPDWVPLIDAYLRYDTKSVRAGHEPQEGLAALLRLLAVEFPWSRGPTVKASKEVLVRDPDCFRALDAMCQTGGLSDLHVATVLGPQLQDRLLPEKLRAMTPLPAGLARAIDRPAAGPALAEALREAGRPGDDPGEPSWGVLGHLVAEARFVHVWRRLSFMRNNWAVPVNEYWAESRPAVAGHRYLPYLEAMTLPPQEASRLLAGFLDRIDLSDLEVKEVKMATALGELQRPKAPYVWTAASIHHDMTAHDLAEVCFHQGQGPNFAHQLLRISGHSPYARAVLIEKDWEFAKTRLAQWEKDPAAAEAPALLAALARRYTAMGRPDDARRALERYIRFSPDYWSYGMLAENYQARGDLKRFKATLDEYLEKGEDSGLDHASVRVKLAYSLMGRGLWAEARPYAEDAAQTGAGWAMECAGQCHEGLGDFPRAESWFRQEAERYPNSFMQWFLFCNRTGRGDAAAAARLAADFVGRSGSGLTDNEKCLTIFLYDLTDDTGRGVAFLRTLVRSEAPAAGPAGGRLAPWIEQMFLAMFADAAEDVRLRDEAWARVVKGDHPAAAGAAALFRDTLKTPARGFDRKAFDGLLNSTDGVARSFLGYFAGRFLGRLGRVEDAAYYLERYSVTIPGGSLFVPLLAGNALRACLNGKIPADPHLYVLRATYHRTGDRPDLALKDLDEAVRIDPKNKEALNLRGVVRRNGGDLDGAIADFSRLIELDPDLPSGRLGRGVTYILQGQDARAGEDIDRIIERAPGSGIGQMGRGLLALARGKEADADAAFGQAMALDNGLASTIETLKKAVKQKRAARPT